MLVVLDGWGWREDRADNAVLQARTPTFDRLWTAVEHRLRAWNEQGRFERCFVAFKFVNVFMGIQYVDGELVPFTLEEAPGGDEDSSTILQ